MAKIFIGVGHGGKDSGAVANGFKEKNLNLSVATFLKDELERHKVSVLMSRTTDTDEKLNDKIKKCNAAKADYALDIHHNAGGGDGAEIFHHFGGGKGKVLAKNILDEIEKIGQNSRGLKVKKNVFGKDYFGFIRDISAPAIIVECAFMDSKDIETVNTAKKQKNMAVAIAKGILKTLGINYITKTAEESTKLYKVQVGAFSKKENAKALVEKLKALGYSAVIV